MIIRFIGDVHGKFAEYEQIAKASPDNHSIQVGDMGIGFSIPPMFPVGGNHFFIRGNHDDPSECLLNVNFIRDGHISDDGKILYVGGGASIDKHLRTEGVDWWSDEEMTIANMNNILDNVGNPEIVVSHDCPAGMIEKLFPWALKLYPSRTQQFLDALHSTISPKLWVFGHWHRDVDISVDGTRWLCLNELSFVDVEI